MAFEIKCMYPRRVDSLMIQTLPLVRYTGETVLVETIEQLDAALPEISREEVLGFDTETRPNFSKGKHYPVSILQLGGERKVWIMRLEPLSERLADVYKVLENPSVKKVGIAVQGDIKALRSLSMFSPAGFVDVSESTSNLGVINTGMRNLTAVVFGERLSKAAQLTNWASDRLTEKQIEYAATDAWISRRLFIEIRKVIEENRITIEPEPIPEPERFNLRNFVRNTIRKVLLGIRPEPLPSPKPKGRGGKRGGGFARHSSSHVSAASHSPSLRKVLDILTGKGTSASSKTVASISSGKSKRKRPKNENAPNDGASVSVENFGRKKSQHYCRQKNGAAQKYSEGGAKAPRKASDFPR